VHQYLFAGVYVITCELEDVILNNRSNRRLVTKHDDRLNPVMNLDAVGRMLTYHIVGPRYKSLDRFHTAMLRYAGTYNSNVYWKDVTHKMKMLGSTDAIVRLEKRFNVPNPELTINGVPADFKTYITFLQQQNYNYGLAEYEKLTLYRIPKTFK
jgi:hypothetical protein